MRPLLGLFCAVRTAGIALTQPTQAAFMRADRAQRSSTSDCVTIGAPPMPATRRGQEDTRPGLGLATC